MGTRGGSRRTESPPRRRIALPDQLAQLSYVTLRLDVLAFIFTLGVDDQAVGAVLHGLGSHVRLEDGVVAVHVLPRAHVQPAGVQLADEAGIELRPHGRAVRALDDQRADAVVARGGDDARDGAATRARDVPDPHAATGQRLRVAGHVHGMSRRLTRCACTRRQDEPGQEQPDEQGRPAPAAFRHTACHQLHRSVEPGTKLQVALPGEGIACRMPYPSGRHAAGAALAVDWRIVGGA